MTPAEYYDWWFYSGIAPGIPTRPGNHAALRERISAAGVHVIVLWELLRENAEFDETTYIAPHGIHGAHERVADAARAVGAPALAAFLSLPPAARTLTPETHRELKSLLKRYASRHGGELAGDIARHGDARAAVGFDKRQARRRRDELGIENEQRHQHEDQLPFFVEPMKELRKLLATGMTLSEVREQNDPMALLAKGVTVSAHNESMTNIAVCFQYEFPRWAKSPQPPEVARFLDECRQLTEQYPKQLPRWEDAEPTALEINRSPTPQAAEVSTDRNVLDGLRAIGLYTTERIGPLTLITWDSVPALEGTIAPMAMRFTYAGEFPVQLLTAWPDARRRFSAALPRMSELLVAQGREQITDDELRPDDEQLLSQVNRGVLSIAVEANPSPWRVDCSWEVEWDPEHVCTFEIDERGGLLRVE